MDWQQVEVMGYAHYVGKGYRVLVPLVSGEGYDFVAEKDGEYVRVNVKMAGLKDRTQANSWCISQASGSTPEAKDSSKVDVYLAWMPAQKIFVEIPGEFLNGGNSKSKRIPTHLYTQ